MQIKQLIQENKTFIFKAFVVFIFVWIVSSSFGGDMDKRMKDDNQNVITVSGHGEVNAVPDIASIYFTVESGKTTQKESSDEVNTKVSQVLAFLKTSDIAEKDIKTDGYNSYPKYSNPTPCPLYYRADGVMPPCPQSEAKIIGYSVSQSITVKIRKVDDSSKIIDGINKIGVTNMSGPTLSIDDEDGLKAEARKKAIDDAKAKAKVLAKDLGIRLGHISNFNENGNNYYPMYASSAVTKDVAMGGGVPSEIPKGENTISSDVSITYEIR